MRPFFKTVFWIIAVVILLDFVTEKMSHYEAHIDFVILAGKVGHPAVMTTFRVSPHGSEKNDPNYCKVGGDKLYTPYNVSVFTEAKIGDVLRRYHYTQSFKVLGKTIYQDCHDMFVPVEHVSLYPDRDYWPFGKDDLKPGDPDYDRIAKLTRSQQ